MNEQRARQLRQQAVYTAPSAVWVPAIPPPLPGARKRCPCGAGFWTMDGYRGHYALKHVFETQFS